MRTASRLSVFGSMIFGSIIFGSIFGSVVGVLSFAGCTDSSALTRDGAASDGSPGDAAATTADLAFAPDLLMPDLTMSLGLGHDCPMGNECGPGQICLSSKLDKSLPAGGYCTKPCANDPDCGGDAFCGPPLPGIGSLCFPNCGPNGTCTAQNRVCGRRLNGTVDLVKTACLPGNPTAKDGSACSSFGDCNRNQVCQNNPFEAPGGACITIGCSPGDNTTCSPAAGNTGLCLVAGANLDICLPTCAMDSDCRTLDKFSCVDVSGQGKGPNICAFVHNRPGAACKADTQCSAAGTAWRCLMGTAFPNGYCGAALGACNPKDGLSCPEHAGCFDPTPNKPGDEFCAALCNADGDCRMADGYRCLPIDGNGNKGCRLP